MGIKDKDKKYSGYTFRHTWATIAQNDCDANLFEVAFGMNHSHGFRVTRGYVKLDFSPAWRLNAKVIELVFFSDKKSKQGMARDLEESENKLFRISKKMMILGRAIQRVDMNRMVTIIRKNVLFLLETKSLPLLKMSFLCHAHL